jgi:class 3 adenylate cyclase
MIGIRTWIRVATDPSTAKQSLLTCLVVGSLLTAINHGEDLLRGRFLVDMAWQIALTFLVPLLVSTTSSVAAIQRQRTGSIQEYVLLEREIKAINKFPGQNPNPVLRVATDGRLLYANGASAPITSSLQVNVGDHIPPHLFAELTSAAADVPARAIEVRSGWRTFAVLPIPVPEFDFLNLYGTDITAARAIRRFPDENPNPVLRMSEDGALVYANPASEPLVGALGLELGGSLPVDLLERLRRASAGPVPESVEVQGDGRTWALRPVAVPEFGFTNIYGTDVTALKAINKFPDQNPNPVLRVSRDSRLTYANPASALVRKALGAEVGDELPGEVFARIQTALAADLPETLEVESDGRVFALLVVSVFEFESINVYGTDITAAREVEQANRENERLLLNILPVSIARRLKQGEVVIADRFEEMTVLFADCVGFTRMSSQLSPAEVVEMLNAMFSIFDGLADRYGLEKIKTIGDAYMVVGGLTPGASDHAADMADMALEMIAGVAPLREETGRDLEIRVGMHTGPGVAGVIGLKKFIYDVWGDTVNMASRMESLGLPGRIQVSEATYDRLKDSFIFEPRAIMEVKGKGQLATYFLVGRR